MLSILEVKNRLTASAIEQAVTDAAESYDAAPFLLGLEETIIGRTLRGEFLDGSSPSPGQYRSASHVKARQAKGFQTSHVDLRFTGGTATKEGGGRGNMLDEMSTRTRPGPGSLTMELGYIEGLSDDEAAQLAAYHNDEGAGTSRVVRRFVGVTSEEEAEQVALFVKGFAGALRRSFGAGAA